MQAKFLWKFLALWVVLLDVLQFVRSANTTILLKALGDLSSSTGTFTSQGGFFDGGMRACTLWAEAAKVYFTVSVSKSAAHCILVCFSSVAQSSAVTPISSPTYGVAVVQMNGIYCMPEPQDASGDVVNIAVLGEYVSCAWNGHMCYPLKGMLTTLRLGNTAVPGARIGTAANALADDCLSRGAVEQCRYIPAHADEDIFDGGFNHDGNVVYSLHSDLAVAYGWGSDEGADIDVVVWGAKNYERQSKQYCIIDVGGDYPSPFSAWVVRMCNMKCSLSRKNVTVPIVPGREEAIAGIGWDTNFVEIQVEFEEGIDWFADRLNPESITACWERRWDNPPSQWNVRKVVACVVLGTALLGICVCLCFRRAKQKRHRAELRQVFVTPEGYNVNLSQLLSAKRRLAVVVSNQSYVHYSRKGVTCAHADSAAVESFFQEYYENVISLRDATLEDMQGLPSRILSAISGLERPLVPIYYAGHSLEIGAGNLLFAPVDAHPANPASHFSKVDLCRDLHDLNSRKLQHELSLKQTPNAIFVVMADCCRCFPRNESPFIAHISSQRFSNSVILKGRTRDVTRPRFFFAFACDPHRAAREDSEHGHFTRAFLEEACYVRPLVNLFASVSARVEQQTGHLQRPWISVDSSLGFEGLCVSLISEQASCSRVLDSAATRGSNLDGSSVASTVSHACIPHGATGDSLSSSLSTASSHV